MKRLPIILGIPMLLLVLLIWTPVTRQVAKKKFSTEYKVMKHFTDNIHLVPHLFVREDGRAWDVHTNGDLFLSMNYFAITNKEEAKILLLEIASSLLDSLNLSSDNTYTEENLELEIHFQDPDLKVYRHDEHIAIIDLMGGNIRYHNFNAEGFHLTFEEPFDFKDLSFPNSYLISNFDQAKPIKQPYKAMQPKHGQYLKALIEQFNQDLSNEYDLHYLGSDHDLLGGIRKIGLSFQTCTTDPSETNAKHLISEVVEKLLEKLNHSKELSLYMLTTPFSIRELAITIEFQHQEMSTNKVSRIDLSDGMLLLYSKGPDNQDVLIAKQSYSHNDPFDEELSFPITHSF